MEGVRVWRVWECGGCESVEGVSVEGVGVWRVWECAGSEADVLTHPLDVQCTTSN